MSWNFTAFFFFSRKNVGWRGDLLSCLFIFYFLVYHVSAYIPPFLHIFLPGFLAHSLDILFTAKMNRRLKNNMELRYRQWEHANSTETKREKRLTWRAALTVFQSIISIIIIIIFIMMIIITLKWGSHSMTLAHCASTHNGHIMNCWQKKVRVREAGVEKEPASPKKWTCYGTWGCACVKGWRGRLGDMYSHSYARSHIIHTYLLI